MNRLKVGQLEQKKASHYGSTKLGISPVESTSGQSIQILQRFVRLRPEGLLAQKQQSLLEHASYLGNNITIQQLGMQSNNRGMVQSVQRALPQADLGTSKRSRAHQIDWGSQHQGIEQSGPLRNIFEQNLQQQLQIIFGSGTTKEMVNTRIREAERNGQTGESHRLRTNLFRANEYAVIETLNVEDSERYQPINSPKRKTFCNIYTYDVVTALGGYLPRVWWNQRAIERLQRGEEVQPIYNRTVREMGANDLVKWMEQFGADFGWQHASNMMIAQDAANNGKIVVLLAANRDRERSGHINVIVAETPVTESGASSQQALRTDNLDEFRPLQSQAGSKNFKFGTHSNRWWVDNQHEQGAAWIYEGVIRSPLLTPEQAGVNQGQPNTVLPTALPLQAPSVQAPLPVHTEATNTVNNRVPTNNKKNKQFRNSASHVVTRNEEFSVLLGWLSQSDKIVNYFQKLGLLPLEQSPAPTNFARAVKAYQQRHSDLSQDGILGPATWRMLELELAFDIGSESFSKTNSSLNFNEGVSNKNESTTVPNTPTTPTISDNSEVSTGDKSGFRLAAEIVGKSEGSYDSINTWDRGKVSYGRYQFALITSHLFKVLNRWVSSADSAKQAPEACAVIKDRLEKVRKHDGSLAGDKEFLTALRQAGRTQSMQKTQDEYWRESFFAPAAKKAEKQGVNSAIGKAIFTDTNTQGGLKYVIERTAKALAQKPEKDRITDSYEWERHYLNEFLTQRANYLLHLAEKNQQKSQEYLKEASQLRLQGKEDEAKGLERKAKSLEKTANAFIGAANKPNGRIARLRSKLEQELPKQNSKK